MTIKFGNYSLSFHRPDWAIFTAAQHAKRAQGADPNIHQVSFLFFKGKRRLTPDLMERIAYRKELDAWVKRPHPAAQLRSIANLEAANRKHARRVIDEWTRSGEHGTLHLGGVGLSVLPPLPGNATDVDFTHNQLTDWPDTSQLPQALKTLTLTDNPLNVNLVSREYRATLPSGLTLVFGNERISSGIAGRPRDELTRTWSERLQQWTKLASESERDVREQVEKALKAWHEDYAAGMASSKASSKGKSTVHNPQPLAIEDGGLTSCPPLPEGIVQVSFRGNRFTSLPMMSEMPDTLRVLDLTDNHITQFAEDHVASRNGKLTVNLGPIVITPEQNTLLQEAYPGPRYIYTSTSSASKTSSARLDTSTARGDATPAVGTPRSRPVSIFAPADDTGHEASIPPRNELRNALGDNDPARLQTLLMAHPELVNSQDDMGRTILHDAVLDSLSDAVKHLLAAEGILINVLDNEGRSPLHHAALSGNSDIVKALVNKASLLHTEDIRFLMAPDTHEKNPLHHAVENVTHSASLIPLLLPIMRKEDLNKRDGKDDTPLDIIVVNGDLAGLKELLKSPEVAINDKDSDGNTALIKAVIHGHHNLIGPLARDDRILVNLQNSLGNAAIHYAVMSNNNEIFEMLLKHPLINVNLAGEGGMTLLHHAIKERDIGMAKKLVKRADIDPNVGDAMGNTAMHHAVSSKDLEFVHLLLTQKKIDVNRKNNVGTAPLHICASVEDFPGEDIVEILLRYPHTDLYIKNGADKTAFDIATSYNNSFFTELYDERIREQFRSSGQSRFGHERDHHGSSSGAGRISPEGGAFTGPVPEKVLTAMIVLGLSPGSKPTLAEVTKAFKNLAKQKHPDKVLHNDPERKAEATAEFQKIANAYSVVGNYIQPGFDKRA